MLLLITNHGQGWPQPTYLENTMKLLLLLFIIYAWNDNDIKIVHFIGQTAYDLSTKMSQIEDDLCKEKLKGFTYRSESCQ
jgi:hypothetical protein